MRTESPREEAASEIVPEMCQLMKDKTLEATGIKLCGQEEQVCGLETKTEFIKHLLCWGHRTCNCVSPQSLGGITLCLIRGHVPLTERLEPGRLTVSMNPGDLITHH